MLGLDKTDLAGIDDATLRELVARLCEAEVEAAGLSRSGVRWGGAQTAPDGGLDVEAKLPGDSFEGNWLKRPWTGVQVKRSDMPRSDILHEMAPKGRLRPIIQEIGEASGGYLIASLEDAAPAKLKNRRAAMREAVEGFPFADKIHLDFIGRNELVRWLDLHPAVETWLRKKIGKPISGWRRFGRWSRPPKGADDTLILSDGVRVRMPPHGDEHDLASGIEAIRELVRSGERAVRIVGLSGVGKTRIVQALFEETVGGEPLPRSKALYADLGEELQPTARQMLDTLIEKQTSAILILDNCPTGTHSSLAQTLTEKKPDVRLITIEYDIRDDKPEQTSVVSIVPRGIAAVEELLVRRYPRLSDVNAHRIADFAQGNARVALALAERIEDGENVSGLSSDELFRRLFVQRNGDNEELLEAAECLSLVYSFSVEPKGDEPSELKQLSRLNDDASLNRMNRHLAELTRRQVVQSRGQWRAVLPHAIANRLAARALETVPFEELVQAFEDDLPPRMRMSFAHRLAFMHDHPVAQRIAERWLSPGGILADPTAFEPDHLRLFSYIAATNPPVTLSTIERWLSDEASAAAILNSRFSARATISGVLAALAYEPASFKRAAECLLHLAALETSRNNGARSGQELLSTLFSPVLSGTQASAKQRADLIERMLGSNDDRIRSIGVSALGSALRTGPWTASRTFDFGAWSRDYGFMPRTTEQWRDWYATFLNLAKHIHSGASQELTNELNHVLGRHFRYLWRQAYLRDELEELANYLNQPSRWVEGWHAVKQALNYDQDENPESSNDQGKARLKALAEKLQPDNLSTAVRLLILSSDFDIHAAFNDSDAETSLEVLDDPTEQARALGQELAHAPSDRPALLKQILENANNYSIPLGEGLFSGPSETQELWTQLMEAADRAAEGWQCYGIFIGALRSIVSAGDRTAHAYLDVIAEHPTAKAFLVELQSHCALDEHALERLKRHIGHEDNSIHRFDRVVWTEPYVHLDSTKLTEIFDQILAKPDGRRVLIGGFKMRSFNKMRSGAKDDPLIAEYALKLVISSITEWQRLNRNEEGDIISILECYANPQQNAEKLESIINAIIAFAKSNYGSFYGLEKVLDYVAKLVPETALDALYSASTEDDGVHTLRMRREAFEHRGPLTSLPADTYLSWAQQSDMEERFAWLGAIVWPFVCTAQNGFQLSDAMIKLLKAAPNPQRFLTEVSNAAEPTSWSGSLADKIERRCEAFRVLKSHQSLDIRQAAGEVIAQIEKRAAARREWEVERDATREQAFE